ncbi:hypothetical protein PWT90_07021 [Aphanocladium album]|nr:hypothetical protein PWT90_07021 [Aphanocladium album]
MQRIAASNAMFYSDPDTATWVNNHDFARYGDSVTLPISARTLNWIPYQLDAELATLLDYFHIVASKSLIVFGCSSGDILQLVLRMALSDHTLSAVAVLQVILAFSTLHRDGPSAQAIHLKVKALRALASSVTADIDATATAHHVVCGMFLCLCEMRTNSDTSYQWLWYVCGAKSLIKTQRLDGPDHNKDFDIVVGWAQYYEVMARFSLRHWGREHSYEFEFAENLGYHAALPSVCARGNIAAELDNPPIAMLDLLREVIDIAEAPSISQNSSSGYTEYALELEDKLHNAYRSFLEQLRTVPKRQTAIAVFCLAVLVYLLRLTSTHGKDKSTKIDGLLDEAFGHLAELDSLPFPLAILLLGLEARNDRERKVIVKLIAGTERDIPTQALLYVKSITASSWVQEDLRKDCSDGSIGYMENMNRLISSFKILPTFI